MYESMMKMQKRYEQEMWDDYYEYGESSIKWQEHCRFIESQKELDKLDSEMINENDDEFYSDEDLDDYN